MQFSAKKLQKAVKTWKTPPQKTGSALNFTTMTTLPAASSTYGGYLVLIPGSSTTADALYLCLKSATNTYAWNKIYSG